MRPKPDRPQWLLRPCTVTAAPSSTHYTSYPQLLQAKRDLETFSLQDAVSSWRIVDTKDYDRVLWRKITATDMFEESSKVVSLALEIRFDYKVLVQKRVTASEIAHIPSSDVDLTCCWTGTPNLCKELEEMLGQEGEFSPDPAEGKCCVLVLPSVKGNM